MNPKWSLEKLLLIVSLEGAEVGEDNDGQIIIYTGYRENENGELEKMED